MPYHTCYKLQTGHHEMVAIDAQVREAIQASHVKNGLCLIFCPHTTAAITINENADPTVQDDMILALADLIPDDPRFTHLEGNSAAHLKASLVGASEQIIVQDGKPLLGTWQGIYFMEFDGPRTRTFHVCVMGDVAC